MPDYQSTVLIVDDYDVNLELLEAHLIQSHSNLKILKAKNGLDAMEIFNSCELDLVLLDVMLPDINGFDLCRMMKTIREENFLPIILITALYDRESMLEGLSNGADDFLSKPVNSDELMVRVNNLLRLRRMSVDLNRRYQELSSDLKLARELLNDFLPRQLPPPEDVHTEIIYEPSSIIGGDFYDILFIDDDHYGFFMADVKGHGASAAMIVALIKEQIYEQRDEWTQPVKLIDQLNQTLCRFFTNTRDDFFVTACYMVYDKKNKSLSWVNAGHTSPAYFWAGEAKALSEPSGLPLGIFEGAIYEKGEYNIGRFAAILLYTDGIFELPLFYQPERTFSSIDEIFTFLQEAGIKATASMITSEVQHALRRYEQHDDVNIISLKF